MIHRAFSWKFSSFPRSLSFVSIFYICTLEVAETAVLHAATNRPISSSSKKTVAEPDPQIRGRPGHPDPEIKIFFGPSGLSMV